MDELTRRALMTRMAAAAVIMPAASTPTAAQGGEEGQGQDARWLEERRKAVAAGMTEEEADCWVLLGRTAGRLLALPKLHEMEEHEVTHAIHVLQYRLLSRPTYRRYLEISKAGADR